MATYDKILDNENSRVYFQPEERHTHGSSRVGVRSQNILKIESNGVMILSKKEVDFIHFQSKTNSSFSKS